MIHKQPMTKKPSSEEIRAIESVDEVMPRGVDVSSDLPAIADMPLKAQMILALVAVGFSFRGIGKVLGCESATVSYYVTRYDPEGRFTLSKDAKRAFIAKLWEGRAAEALSHITPEKLQQSTARDLAYVAKTAVQAMENNESGKRDRTSDFVNKLKTLAAAD